MPRPAVTSSGKNPRNGDAGRAAALLHWLLTLLIACLALWRPALVEDHLESRLVDWRFRLRNAYQPPSPPKLSAMRPQGSAATTTDDGRHLVAIVAIDEASVARYGSWPWPSWRVAELIEKVGRARPLAVAVDLPLPPQASPWDDTRILEALTSLGQRGVTGLEFRPGSPFAGKVPPWLLASAVPRIDQPTELQPLEASDLFPHLQPPAGSTVAGHANYERDHRGTVRHERLFLRYGGAWMPSLALQSARVAAGLPPEAIHVSGEGAIEFGDTIIPADRRGRLLIDYYGGEGALQRQSAESILAGEKDPKALEGAVVFIGTTGIASYDLVRTPFSDFPTYLPDVERSATVAANILARDFLREVAPAVNLLLVLAAGAAVPLLSRRRRAALSLLLLLGLALAFAALDFSLFLHGLLLAAVYPLTLLLIAGGITVAGQLVGESRGSRRLRRLFSSYVTERVLERLIADPAMARRGGERRELTILFADIRGFTSFSEKHLPEEVVSSLNEYLEAMTEVVFRWDGTLDKFIGDTILAFWGAPLPQEDHAVRALRCALELCSRLDQLNASWALTGRPPFEIGIGITTGTVLVGNIGAEGKKMDYTVIGDQVNLCSRVEELTKTHAAKILITASTFERVEPAVAAGAFGHVEISGPMRVAVKGREELVSVYRVSPGGTAGPGRPDGASGSET